MSRLIAVLVLVATVAFALGQGTFTIRRPVDGATVREQVPILIPRNSIPEGGYLGVYLNDRFLEAVVPNVEGDNYVYRLDTKGRGLPDGQHTIEVVLFVDFGDQPRIVDRSSITINIDNATSIPVPTEGLRLRYNFVESAERVYRITRRSSIATVSQADRALGSRPATIPQEEITNRFLYATDNVYAGGTEGLIRMQALPAVGKDYDIYPTTSGLARYYERQMEPTYTRITNTGREVFSGRGVYFGFDAQAQNLNQSMLLFYRPFAVLPTQPIAPGDVWQAAFLEEDFTAENSVEKEEYTETFPGRGVFEGVEYQNGRRTAKLRYSRAISENEIEEAGGITQVEGDLVRVEEEILLWFDLDEGIVIREERTSTEEFMISVPVGGGGVPGAGGFPGGFGPGGPGGVPGAEGGGPLGPAGFGAPPPGRFGGGDRDERSYTPFPFTYNPRIVDGTPRLFQLSGAGVSGGFTPGAGGQQGTGMGAGGFGRGAGGAGQVQRQFLIISQTSVLTLESE